MNYFNLELKNESEKEILYQINRAKLVIILFHEIAHLKLRLTYNNNKFY